MPQCPRRWAVAAEVLTKRTPIRGTFFGCCASARWSRTRRIAVSSQKSFFMAAPIYRQWICHSPNIMKTDIFAGTDGRTSGKSTPGSIRFDSAWRVDLKRNQLAEICSMESCQPIPGERHPAVRNPFGDLDVAHRQHSRIGDFTALPPFPFRSSRNTPFW